MQFGEICDIIEDIERWDVFSEWLCVKCWIKYETSARVGKRSESAKDIEIRSVRWSDGRFGTGTLAWRVSEAIAEQKT